MRPFNLKKLAAVSVLGLLAVLGTTDVSAQGRGKGVQKQRQKVVKQQKKVNKQQEKLAKERLKLQQQRQAVRSGNDRSNGMGYYRGNANANTNRNGEKFRVYRNGSYYNTDSRGAELLRRAVNSGYQQGYEEGRRDRQYRRSDRWDDSSIYRSGTYGYQTYVDRDQYQYYFQQGFERGYQDGYNSRTQYGYRSNNTMNILGSILSSILNIQSY